MGRIVQSYAYLLHFFCSIIESVTEDKKYKKFRKIHIVFYINTILNCFTTF